MATTLNMEQTAAGIQFLKSQASEVSGEERLDLLQVLAIDCCPHVLEVLGGAPEAQLIPVQSQEKDKFPAPEAPVAMIVVGVSRFPVRRMFISELRRTYPGTPMLLLRKQQLEEGGETVERVAGEFLVSSLALNEDLENIKLVRPLLPFEPCACMANPQNSEVVKEAIKIITTQYSDPDLDLEKVAEQLLVSAQHLSRILNQEVGISFPQLLQQSRIEVAKRMLASQKYSVKQVAYSVGFLDNHYFSRCFKKVTGYKPSEFTFRDNSL